MIVADTDVLIDFLQGKNPAADRVMLELEEARLAVTAVSRFELMVGVRTARLEKIVREFLDAVPCLPLEAASADRAALIRRELEQGGQGIGMADSLIAGIVLNCGGMLLTRNRSHFERVAGLKLATLSLAE
jgi:tRNA(fMet)-specific endonuclease VapC